MGIWCHLRSQAVHSLLKLLLVTNVIQLPVRLEKKTKKNSEKNHIFFKQNATCVTDEFDIGGYHCECDSGFVEEDGICKES